MGNSNNLKIIFHIDMNMFFCSVACIKTPSLKGKAFAVGRENTFKGVISTASYEARKHGIHSAMPIREAYEKLPSLIIINSDFQLYKEYHYKFVNLLYQYSKIIEVASIDEAYVDMTEISKTRHPLDVAKEIQYRLIKEYHLPCSIGIAPTLFLAKMASDIKKPMGITVLRKREIEQILYPLPVGDIFGIGKKTSPKLIDNGIKTIGDFMNINNCQAIISLIGEKSYYQSVNAIKGNTSNIVKPDRYSSNDSISTSETFDVSLNNYEDVFIELRRLTKKLFKKLLSLEYFTKTITITLRDTNFRTITRSTSVEYTNDLYDILSIVEHLIDENYHDEELRLVGVGFGNLKKEKDIDIEYNLFTYQKFINKEEKINDIIKDFKDKYGDDIIGLGVKTKK